MYCDWSPYSPTSSRSKCVHEAMSCLLINVVTCDICSCLIESSMIIAMLVGHGLYDDDVVTAFVVVVVPVIAVVVDLNY